MLYVDGCRGQEDSCADRMLSWFDFMKLFDFKTMVLSYLLVEWC